jgi:hypothetical protein
VSSLALAKIESLTGNTSISVSSAGQATFEHVISQPGSFMFRNKIINGNFDIWQRGNSQTSHGYGSADRWPCYNTGSTKTASRQSFTLGQTDVPGNPKYFMRHVVTSSAGASNNVLMLQSIEDVTLLSGKTITLSFWAKADSNKNIAIDFEQKFGTGGSPSSAVDGIGSNIISLTTSWTKHVINVSIPSISGKTLGTDNNDCLNVIFWFDAGSSFNSRTVNLGQQSGTFDIAQVQIEEGAVATPFEQRPIGLEFSLCQRYYETTGGSGGQCIWAGTTVSGSTTARIPQRFAVVKRSNPTITATNLARVGFPSNSPTAENINITGFNVFITSNSSSNDGFLFCSWTADAEL